MRVKLFSLAQAEKTLPLVRRVVRDIVDTVARADRLGEEAKTLTPTSPRVDQIAGELQQIQEDVERFRGELDRIGVHLKDVRSGLLDFFSRYDGRVVFLCWKLDEGETIGWWHDLDSGFRGRQPITPEIRGRFRGLNADESGVDIR